MNAFETRTRWWALALLAISLGCATRTVASDTSTEKADSNEAVILPAKGLEILELEPTTTPSAVFIEDGKPFCFTGTNNYYLIYKEREMVDDVFVQAEAMGLQMIRTWAFEDRGSVDGSKASIENNEWEPPGTKQGVYFQYWDGKTQSVQYNDGEMGLERLDYVLAQAKEHGVKVTLVFTNNWKDFGGMDQYLKWFDLQYHHEFYTDARAKQAYKNYVKHLVERVNTITNIPYRDDPTIFAWELANEPRCRNFGPYDNVPACKAAVITSWANEMSAYVKSIDPNHMVAVGDEGFYDRGGTSEQYNGIDGVDHDALLAIPTVDFGTFHLYPDNWGTGVRFGNDWVTDHIASAQKAGKPTVLEEYGIVVMRDPKTNEIKKGWERREPAYVNWNNLMLERGGNATMFWILVGKDPYNKDTGYYEDYDHFSVYNLAHDPTATLLKDYAEKFSSHARACELAEDAGVTGPSTPFVRTAPPSGTATPQPTANAFERSQWPIRG